MDFLSWSFLPKLFFVTVIFPKIIFCHGYFSQNKIQEISGKRFTINNLTYYRMDPFIDNNGYQMLLALVQSECDFVLCKINNEPFELLHYCKLNGEYIITIRIIRCFDAFSSIKIHFPEKIYFDNCDVQCQIFYHDNQTNEINFEIAFDKSSKMMILIDNTPNRYININALDIKLIIKIDKNNNITNICKNMTLSYDALLVNDIIRRKKKDDYIIDHELAKY